MGFNWLKRYMPRSLYTRAALILALPVITIQLVVSVVFIQRHFEGVTRQLTTGTVLEIARIVDTANAQPDAERALAAASDLAEALVIDVRLPVRPILGDTRVFYDWSSQTFIPFIRERLPGVTGFDLSDLRRVRLTVTTRNGVMEIAFWRGRVSASNPHQLLVLMVFVSVVMTVIAAIYLRNQLRPIKRLAEAAEAFGRGRTLPYRPAGATEVRSAGSAFLDMRNRIERQTQSRTMMLSSVSHDLRTPLTRIRLGLSMLDPTPETGALQDDVVEMEAMIARFLDFARLEALDDPVPTPPGQLVNDLVDRFRRGGQRLDTGRVASTGDVLLRPQAITRALENLAANAFRHGQTVRLSVQAGDRAVIFRVEDDGPGIAESDRAEALKPFSRLDTARNQDRGGGVGLGLAIAEDIARQHGGSLRLGRSDSLRGLRADLILAR